jgi:diaminopimelate epimerase
MNYYNRDGSFGAMCGNGARCTAQFAIDEGILNDMRFSLEAVDKIYGAEITGVRRVRITFPDIVKYETGLVIDTEDAEFDISMANWIYVGSEHIVVFVDDFSDPEIQTVDGVDVQSYGSFLRYYKDFAPRGANVNFVELIDGNKIRIRTYERGVERETLACGTGIVSSAIISGIMREVKSPVTLKVQSGEELTVSFVREGDAIKNVTLEGSAKKIGEGVIARE